MKRPKNNLVCLAAAREIVMVRGPQIVVRTIEATRVDDTYGNQWQYLSRSDRHSKAACWAILFDLLQSSRTLAKHVASGEVVFGINHAMSDFKNNREKDLDLVLCTPREDEVRKSRKPHTLASLVDEYGIVLDDSERNALSALPALKEAAVGAVRVALEAKACMTAHIKAIPRLYDELNSSHRTVHGAAEFAIAAGFVMINLSESFVSYDRNKRDLKTSEKTITTHKQPGDAKRVLEKVEQMPRRSGTADDGFDALACVIVDCKNDLGPVKLVSDSPAPPPGSIFHYETMITRLAQAYDHRFGR